MYTQNEKSKENKSRAIANSLSHKGNNVKQCFGLVDNRPETKAQRVLQRLNSPNALQLATNWKIYKSARKHYDDGWGALYNIIRDQDIKDDINSSGTTAKGKQSLSLGTYYHDVENVRRWCSIGYENYDKNLAGDYITDVFHCGPSS